MAHWGELKCPNCAVLEAKLIETAKGLAGEIRRADAAEAKLAECEKYRDAYAECDRIGTQAVRDLEVKLAKAVWRFEHLEKYGDTNEARDFAADALAELTGGKNDG